MELVSEGWLDEVGVDLVAHNTLKVNGFIAKERIASLNLEAVCYIIGDGTVVPALPSVMLFDSL